MANSILNLCRSYRRRSYFVDVNGLVGVYNHCNKILWYQLTEAGYSLTGSTKNPQGAKLRYLS